MPGASVYQLLPEYLTVGVPPSMNVTAVHLTDGHSEAAGTVFDSAAFTLQAYRLCVVTIAWFDDTVTEVDSARYFGTHVGGYPNNAFVKVRGVAFGTSNYRHLQVFRFMHPQQLTGILRIIFPEVVVGCVWSVEAFTGLSTEGEKGAGAIARSRTQVEASATSISVTMPDFYKAANVSFGAAGVNSALEDLLEGTGFSVLGEAAADTANPTKILTEWKASEDLSIDVSWTSTLKAGAIGLELTAIGLLSEAAGLSFADAVDFVVEGYASGAFTLTDAVGFLYERAVAEGVALTEATAFEVMLGAVGNGTIGLADAVSFIIEMAQAGAIALSESVRALGRRPDDEQTVWRPEWLVRIEDT